MTMLNRGTLDVEVWREDPDGEPEPRCPVCGDRLEVGDAAVWHPMPEIHERAISAGHAACAVRNWFRLRYPGEDL